jgi:hypothetical protein
VYDTHQQKLLSDSLVEVTALGQSCSTGAQGYCTLHDLPGPSVTLRLSHLGYVVESFSQSGLRTGRIVDTQRQLYAAGDLIVHVRDALSGAPLPGGWVTGTPFGLNASVDSAGDARFVAIRATSYSLTVRTTNYRDGAASVTVQPGQSTEVTILQTPLEQCSDGTDNDGDSLADCDDPDCTLGCPEADCANGWDDDGDGYADCQDPGCQGDPACSEICTDGWDNDGNGATDCDDWTCACYDVNCSCSGYCWGEDSCSDGFDNDCDSLTDCQDIWDCACSGLCGEVCDDGEDNDCDGYSDCEDGDCSGVGSCP